MQVASTEDFPSISVLMPVKNGAAFLDDAIASILNQTFRKLELLIIDDGSSDESMHIAEKFEQNDDRVKILRNPGVGLVDALNFGISAAKAPFIARMDADDVSLPDRLQKQYLFLLANPTIDVVGTQVSFIDQTGRRTGKVTSLPESPEAVAKTLLKYCCLRHPTVLMRRAAVDRVGGYRSQVPAAEDLDLWLRMAEHGRLANLSEALLLYRLHPAQVSQSKVWTQRLSRNLAIVSAHDRRAGRLDPLSAYKCFSANTGRHTCHERGCVPSLCNSLKAFRAAEALLTDPPGEVTLLEARLLLRYVSRNSIGDGKTNRVRALVALSGMALKRNAPVLLMRAFWTALRIHPGRAVRLLSTSSPKRKIF